MTAHAHGRLRNQPVAPHLGDESSEPPPKVDTFAVELNRLADVRALASLVVEGVLLRVLPNVANGIRDHANRTVTRFGWFVRFGPFRSVGGFWKRQGRRCRRRIFGLRLRIGGGPSGALGRQGLYTFTSIASRKRLHVLWLRRPQH